MGPSAYERVGRTGTSVGRDAAGAVYVAAKIPDTTMGPNTGRSFFEDGQWWRDDGKPAKDVKRGGHPRTAPDYENVTRHGKVVGQRRVR